MTELEWLEKKESEALLSYQVALAEQDRAESELRIARAVAQEAWKVYEAATQRAADAVRSRS